MAQVLRQPTDLPAVVGIVLHQVSDHVHDTSGHAFDAGLTRLDRRLELLRQNVCRLTQRALRLPRCRAQTIERRGTGAGTSHSREHSSHALHVRNDRGDRTAPSGWRGRSPQCGGKYPYQVLIHLSAVSEGVEKLALDIQRSISRHEEESPSVAYRATSSCTLDDGSGGGSPLAFASATAASNFLAPLIAYFTAPFPS